MGTPRKEHDSYKKVDIHFYKKVDIPFLVSPAEILAGDL